MGNMLQHVSHFRMCKRYCRQYYLYMNLLMLILGDYSNGSAMISTSPILLYAGIDLLTSAISSTL